MVYLVVTLLHFCLEDGSELKVNEVSASSSTKQDPSRPIGERQSPDGQEEPKSDSNSGLKSGD